MCTVSAVTAAIGVNAAGEIDDMVTGFCQNAGGKYTNIAIFAVEVKMTVTVLVKAVGIVLPGFKGKVDGRWQVFLLIVFRGAQVNEKTARVGRENVQVIDSQRV